MGNILIHMYNSFLLSCVIVFVRMDVKLFVDHKMELYCYIHGGISRIAGMCLNIHDY